VVGVTPGVIGCIQAAEVIKYLTGEGGLFIGLLLLWDGLAGRGSGQCRDSTAARRAVGAM
jgi:molybdopterin/thiamine biosynthesis adenylyltransferase